MHGAPEKISQSLHITILHNQNDKRLKFYIEIAFISREIPI